MLRQLSMTIRFLVGRLCILVPCVLVLTTMGGCGQGSPTAGVGEDTWVVQFIAGSPAGYIHMQRSPLTENGRSLVEVASEARLRVARAGQVLEIHYDVRSTETPDGRLLGFKAEANLGSQPQITRGEVRNGKMDIEIAGGNRPVRREIPWSPDVLGFAGIELSFEREPMHPSEKRTLRVLLPVAYEVADSELVARDYENTRLLHETARLLHIDCTQRLSGGVELKTVYWVDEHGRLQKTEMSGGEVAYRCSREEAVAPSNAPPLDVIEKMLVRPEQPLVKGYRQAAMLTYDVELREGDPAMNFATGITQQVEPLDKHTAKLTVWTAGPGHLPDRPNQAAEPAPGPEYLAASSLLQLDDPAVQKLARSVTAGKPRSAERAVALEEAVYRAVKQKNFSQAFASAAEVAKSGEGDCTEHAVLLAALARASGIPSRAALGLVYVDAAGGFLFHMWTEVYLDGHWLPLDATMGRGDADATHLKLADSSLTDGGTYGAFFKIAQVVGQLEIK